MKMVDQIKDEYGNLMQLWGIYELEENRFLKEALAFPAKQSHKKLLYTFKSLHEANCYLNNVLNK